MSSLMSVSAADLGIADEFNLATYLVDRQVHAGRSDMVAIEYENQHITYGQLLRRVNQVGNALRALGVRTGERILLILLDGPEFVYCFLGAMKIGAVAVPTKMPLDPSEYAFLLNDSQARVAIISDAVLPRLEAIPRSRLRYLTHFVVAGDGQDSSRSLSDLMESQTSELEPERTGKDDAAFWLYSSGTTGLPKACVHLHHDMAISAELYAKGVLNMSEKDRCFNTGKLFFSYALSTALCHPLAVGATSILWPGACSASNVHKIVERYCPTMLFSTPSSYAALLSFREAAHTEFHLSSVRYAISSAEPLPPAIFRRFKESFGIEILDALGSTEVFNFISNRPGAVRPGSIGQLVPGYEAKLVDDRDLRVHLGQVGNLLIKGDSTCAYYWNRHEQTKDTIQGHWIRTGDKCLCDRDGFFWYIGRSDDMLKVQGSWVSPVEVENTLLEHPAVKEAAVIGHQDGNGLLKPVAYIVVRPGVEPGPHLSKQLQEFARSRLAEHKWPRSVQFVLDLPRTVTGKLQRTKLPSIDREP